MFPYRRPSFRIGPGARCWARAGVSRSCNCYFVDFIDATDYDFLLPRPLRRFIAFALVAGIAFVPPVQRWWLDQIETHAAHVARDFAARFVSDPTVTDGTTTPLSR